jgi:hypothetical protein
MVAITPSEAPAGIAPGAARLLLVCCAQELCQCHVGAALVCLSQTQAAAELGVLLVRLLLGLAH